jgi:hypothetical protein
VSPALLGKPEGKKLLVRPWRTWNENIKMDRKEIGWEGVE